jgi:hypothetical protein
MQIIRAFTFKRCRTRLLVPRFNSIYFWGLFNDAFNSSGYIASNGIIIKTIMNWKECESKRSLPAWSYVGIRLEELTKTMKTLNKGSRCPGRELNQEPPEYKSEMFPLETHWSVPISLVTFVCPYVTTRETLNGLSLLESFTEICRHIQLLIKIGKAITDNKWRPSTFRFQILGWWISLCGFCLRRLYPNKNFTLAMCNT